MDTVFLNGTFVQKSDISISPDDQGFFSGDGVYEVVRWYQGFFYDMTSHATRLKRSLREIGTNWIDVDLFPSIANELIKLNNFENTHAIVYLQVTRGIGSHDHIYSLHDVKPTVYAFTSDFIPDTKSRESGIRVLLKEDIRWSRCDIKSVSLLPNILSFQEAYENGMKECIFVRNGQITEGACSNIFFILDDTLFTHPESNYILSGITRKNILRIAKEAGLKIREEAVHENRIRFVQESFITNTSLEVAPVIELGGMIIGAGVPGPITRLLGKRFDTELKAIRGIS